MNSIADLFPEAPPIDVNAVPDERYTTPSTMEWIRKVCEVAAFDLDVAACAESHHADRYYTKEGNGLLRPWNAPRIFCNPPYSDIEPWLVKAWWTIGLECDLIAMVLPANRTEQPWWQRYVEPFRDGRGIHADGGVLTTHFIPSRVRYGYPGNPTGIGSGSPPFASVLLVWRAP